QQPGGRSDVRRSSRVALPPRGGCFVTGAEVAAATGRDAVLAGSPCILPVLLTGQVVDQGPYSHRRRLRTASSELPAGQRRRPASDSRPQRYRPSLISRGRSGKSADSGLGVLSATTGRLHFRIPASGTISGKIKLVSPKSTGSAARAFPTP